MNERDTLRNVCGKLEIGGLLCEDLARKFGTPLYVMDQTYIENMCRVYDETLKAEYGDGMIAYASKAFSCKEIYRIINDMGIGADSVSGGELYTAKSVNFPMSKICFHGNNKTDSKADDKADDQHQYIWHDAPPFFVSSSFSCKTKPDANAVVTVKTVTHAAISILSERAIFLVFIVFVSFSIYSS